MEYKELITEFNCFTAMIITVEVNKTELKAISLRNKFVSTRRVIKTIKPVPEVARNMEVEKKLLIACLLKKR